jgi:HlyD family type I secretion membrane fusion protein
MNPGINPTPGESTVAARTDLPAQLLRWRRNGLVALALWLALFFTWVALAPVSGAAMGQGVFKVAANRKSVTHRDGGIVAQIHVREGEVVRTGQPLLTLEDVRLDASVELLQAQLDAERLRESRLAAESAVTPAWKPEATPGLAEVARRVPDALARERGSFAARRSALDAQLAAARAQAADADQEILAHQRNMKSSAEGAKLAREELASNEALLKENFVNRVRVTTLQRTVVEYESRLHAIEAELAQARQTRAELAGRLATVPQAYAQSATDDLRESTGRIVDLQARLRAANDTSSRQVVVAPVGGRLVDLRIHTAGSAIGPREPIVDIVPEGEPLVAEVRLSADAVSGVREGLTADIRLPGHALRHLGMLEGRVVNVSPDAILEPRSGLPYFTLLVSPTPESLKALGAEQISAGMAVEVYVNTSRRTPLEFLFDPLTSALRRAFRDQ